MRNNSFLALLTLGMLVVLATAGDEKDGPPPAPAPVSGPMNCKKTTPAENLALVTNFFTKIINETSQEFLNAVPEGYGYIQHNPWARDGKVGLMEDLLPLSTPGSLTIAHSIADGDYVWIHSKATIKGKPHALADIWRMECGRAAEHWDVIMEMVPSAVNDHAYF